MATMYTKLSKRYFSDKKYSLLVKSLCRSYTLSPVFNQAFLAGLQAFLRERGN
jgi:hypothetical protein